MDADEKTLRCRKANEFLWIVQACVLRFAADVLKVDRERQDFQRAHLYSGSGTFICMDEAVRAAGRIPANMDAIEAAREFCDFIGQGDTARPSYWFSRSGLETHDYSAVSKTNQFLWIVQTVILANAENKSARDNKNRKASYDCASVATAMIEAVKAAGKIPDGKDVTKAANEFCSFSISGMREKTRAPIWYRE